MYMQRFSELASDSSTAADPARLDQATLQLLMARGRQMRSEQIATSVKAAFRAVAGLLATRRRKANDIAALRAMSERDLADIGLSRGEIDAVADGAVRQRASTAGNDTAPVATTAKSGPQPRIVRAA